MQLTFRTSPARYSSFRPNMRGEDWGRTAKRSCLKVVPTLYCAQVSKSISHLHNTAVVLFCVDLFGIGQALYRQWKLDCRPRVNPHKSSRPQKRQKVGSQCLQLINIECVCIVSQYANYYKLETLLNFFSCRQAYLVLPSSGCSNLRAKQEVYQFSFSFLPASPPPHKKQF